MEKSKFQFEQPYLQKLVFLENNQFEFENDSVEMHNNFSVQISKSKEKPSALVVMELEMNLGRKESPFTIEASMASLFYWEEDEDENKINRMLEINAPAVLLSYLRPIIAQVTNSSQFPVYNLPFINLSAENVQRDNEPDEK